MAEAPVHEYHHVKLNAIQSLDPLLAGPAGEARFCSPWRSDLRPIEGLLHGAYTFSSVLDLWHRIAGQGLSRDPAIDRRIHLVAAQVSSALEVLRAEAETTPLGSAMLDALEERLRGQIEALPTIDAA